MEGRFVYFAVVCLNVCIALIASSSIVRKAEFMSIVPFMTETEYFGLPIETDFPFT
ncbi:hypothetical protein [Paenibacillus mesophilus]|uniref:hypothetical protein n=1 Tax=Paenibacillus mesophilus TaxID=2582849 RepID=UPI0013053388|nr:hypothetical protein [Paenibacillus mesophilus]